MKPCRDQQMHGVRDLLKSISRKVPLTQQMAKLFRVQRFPVGALHERTPGVVEGRILDKETRQFCHLKMVEWMQLECVRIGRALFPSSPCAREAGPGGAHEHERGVRSVLDEILKKVEDRCICPMQIFQDHDMRLVAGDPVKQAHQRSKDLVALSAVLSYAEQ